VLVGAGDIATAGPGDKATAALLARIKGTVFTAGDNAYPNGSAADFHKYYDPTWGQFRQRTRPSPGNHDYHTSDAAGYFGYFGAEAGPAGRGYYSYDLGDWHIVSLNSNIDMSAGSPEETWLRKDLSASAKPCTLAYWHAPLFTSGEVHPPDPATRPLFKALYDHGAEVVVWGHNHQYERFAPMNPAGRLDAARGIRSFVAGTGGAGLYAFGPAQPYSEARDNRTFGVLEFTLHPHGYDWRFVPQAGHSYTDSGSGTCH
jgi:hypothetical protein